MSEQHTNHYFYLRSKGRRSGENRVNFNISSHKFNNVRSFKIKKCILPYSFYPINSNNNTIIIRKNGDTQDRTAIIPTGNYTLSQLKAEIKTQLDALGGPVLTYTITDSPTKNTITITQSASTFIYRGASTINKIIGFADTDTADQIAQTGTNVYNISGTDNVNIFSEQLTQYDSKIRTSDKKGSGFLCSVPLAHHIYGEVIKEVYDDYIFDFHPTAEGDIDIQLRDDDGNLLDGMNGRDWELILQFHSYSNNHPLQYNRVSQKQGRMNLRDRMY